MSVKHCAKILFIIFALSIWISCAKEKESQQVCSGTLCVEKLPYAEWTPSEVTFERGSVDVDAVAYQDIRITNSGEGVLFIASATVDVDDPASEDAESPTFFLETDLGDGVQIAPVNQGDELGLPESLVIQVGYRRSDGDLRTGSISIVHGSDDLPSNNTQVNPVVISLSEEGATASLLAIPEEVVFQNVKGNTFAERNVTFLNAGQNELVVSQVELIGDESFTIFWEPDDEESAISPGQVISLDPSITIAPGSSVAFKARFQPFDESPKNGTLVVTSNDPTLVEGLNVPLLGNHTGPCIKVEPQALNFGAKLVNTALALPVRISSCGNEPLRILSVSMADDGSADYELDTSSFTVEGNPGAWPASSNPRTIPVDGQGEFMAIFQPSAEAALDESGKPIPEITTIRIKTNTFEGEIPIPVAGYGTNQSCPTPVITFLNGGEQVPPQTELKLTAADSLGTTGSITQVKWYVDQPEGSASPFSPNSEVETVFFSANVAGIYTFRLEVRDEKDWSCSPAEREVVVIPDESIHIELTWDTPGDDNLSDNDGADMDLHFVHWNNASQNPEGEDLYPPPNGDGVVEGFFDQDWDSFWFYVGTQEHDWGVLDDEDDNPSLDRDDTNGAGPENLNLNVPEDGVTYRVGVHYYNDNGKGPSTPAVRIYVFGALLETFQGCSMVQWDLWDVGVINWPDATLAGETCNGATPPADGAAWPTRPCGDSMNNLSVDGGACDQVIYGTYTPCNFVTNAPIDCTPGNGQ